MKTVKFKKWVITAIVSFIATIVLLIISVVVGGASLVHSISRMDSIMATNTMHNMADIMNIDDNSNFNFDFEYSGGFGCDESVSINNQSYDVYNAECDDLNDELELLIENEITQITKDTTITNKQQLNMSLQAVTNFLNNNNLSQDQVIVDNVIDLTSDSIESKFDNTPLTKQMGNHSDFKDYFETKYLDGDSIDNYMTTYINTNIN